MHRLDLTDPADCVFGKMMRAQANACGDTVFLLGDGVRITYAEADAMTDRLAGGLAKLGIGRGDRVAILMGNRPELVLLTFAINKLGAVWIPICTDYKGAWLVETLQRSRYALLVTDGDYCDRVLAERAALPQTEVVVLTEGSLPENTRSYDELLEADPLVSDYAELAMGDTCAVLWTSGTTGRSKGVMQSYKSWIRPITKGASPPYASRDGDVVYCTLPLYHSGAWVTCVLRAFIEGITVVIESRFSVSQFWDRVRELGVTQTFLLGAMGVFLWNAPERDDDADHTLRALQVVPMPPQLWKAFEARFGVKLIRSGLGQSEIQLVMTQAEDRDDVPTYALGFPADDTDVRLCDDAGREVAPGEPGEICIKALDPHVLFNGYFDDPGATDAAYRDGYFLTGDLARQDPETGAYFYVDRKKDVVRFAGRNISTLEVESVVRRCPGVADVAAFGVQSREVESEHELKLNVVREPGADLSSETLCTFINENAPYYFVPRYVEWVDALPYTPTNKVQKFALRDAGVTAATWDRQAAGFEVQR